MAVIVGQRARVSRLRGFPPRQDGLDRAAGVYLIAYLEVQRTSGTMMP
jgi:hypothetical protein